MKLLIALIVLVLVCAAFPARAADGPRVVLLTDCNGFVHDVVKPTDGDSLVAKTLRGIVEKTLGGSLVHLDDAAKLGPDDFDPAKTKALVFYTTGDIPLDLARFNSYLENGGSMLGIHCATDTLAGEPAYHKTIGGSFDGHPWNADASVVLKTIDLEHAAVEPIGGRRGLKEEMYQFKNFDPATVRVLAVLDMERTALKRPHLVPVVWAKQVGKGRVLYTSLGHRDDVWRADWYQQHLTQSLRWLMGDARGSAEPNPRESEREARLARSAFGGAQDESRRPQGGEAISADAAQEQTPQPAAPATRPHDPWVFRCVLDGRPRSVVVALDDDMWIAYDATACTLYKAWAGGMTFTGGVYDGKHGPQPQADGKLLAQFTDADRWALVKGDEPVDGTTTRWAGYAIDGKRSVALKYEVVLPDGGKVTLAETPSLEDGKLVRRFVVEGLPEGHALRFPRTPGGEPFTLSRNGEASIPVAFAPNPVD